MSRPVTSSKVFKGTHESFLFKTTHAFFLFLFLQGCDLTKPATFLCSLEAGGIPPKFVIIDDGWQSVSMDDTGVEFNADNAAK